MFSLIVADTKLVLEFDCTALAIAESSLSISVNTFERSIVVFEASSLTVVSNIALETVGESSTALTVTVKESSTVNSLEVPRTTMVAMPF